MVFSFWGKLLDIFLGNYKFLGVWNAFKWWDYGSWSFWFSVDCLEVLEGMPPLCIQYCTNSLYFSILVCINYQSGELNMCLGAFKDHLPCAS